MISAAARASPSVTVGNRSAVAALKKRFQRQNVLIFGALFVALALLPRLPGVQGWMAAQAAIVIIYIVAAQGVEGRFNLSRHVVEGRA